MSQNSYVKYLEAATDIAKQAGQVLEHYWGNLSSIKRKSFSGDLVTEADHASEKVIIEAIQKQFPSHSILSEESGSFGEQKGWIWVVDPLDGTTNYTHQFPLFCVSIALVYKQQTVVGVVYHPLYKELYQAIRGEGAWLNGEKMCVSSTPNLVQSLLSTGFAYNRRHTKKTNYPEFCRLTHISHGVRRGGSAALDLAYVAAGRLDGFWERGLKSWDVAAGALLVEEAGGSVSAFDQSSFAIADDKILASNGVIHEALSHELIYVEQHKDSIEEGWSFLFSNSE